MADIDRFRADDRRGIEQLYRRSFGTEAPDALRLRWDWEHRRNPAARGEASFFVAREGPTVIAAAAIMPVRVSVGGRDYDGGWAVDPLVAAERQRQGLAETLLRTWDRQVGVGLGARVSSATAMVLERMRWPAPVTLPCLVKPLSRRALRRPTWPVALNRFVSAVTLPFVRIVARARPIRDEVEIIRRFDEDFDRLWERAGGQFDLAVRRDVAYLNWRFIEPPHVRYTVAALRREDRIEGYAVYRHMREPHGRVTQIVDLLADPADEGGLKALLRWIDREARAEDSDKIRCFTTHAAFRRALRRSGYFPVKSAATIHVKVNAEDVGADFYTRTDNWHFTIGDGEQDH
jgi:hypothetical protein